MFQEIYLLIEKKNKKKLNRNYLKLVNGYNALYNTQIVGLRYVNEHPQQFDN